MKVFFRVDASLCMGIGHFMRCLTLADALRDRGKQVRFICREHNGHLIDKLSQKAIPVTVLPASVITDSSGSENYAAWLGVSQAVDAKESIEAINKEMPDWLVVDHYGLDVEWEELLRPHVKRLMVIDDLANRRHDCDLLLDQNFGRHEQDYKGIVNSDCQLLIGPHYALIRPEYVTYRKTLRERDGQVNRVLVFFGGSDPDNMTGLALHALSKTDLRHLQVDLVIGANNQHREKLEKQAQQRLNTRIYGPRPHLADLMAQADIAIGASGATTWERMCLGLPTVVVSIAENQKPASEALFEAGLIEYAGHFSDIKQDQLVETLRLLCESAKKRANVSVYNKLLVDGLGSSRLIEFMFPSTTSELCLRPASLDDIILYYNWANDPEVRKNAINMAYISWETHSAWFLNKLHVVKSRLFVLEVAGLPVGQIRFDMNGDEANIDYSLDTIVRGRGWGSHLLAMGTNLIQEIVPVKLRATVKDQNNAPASIFLHGGFSEKESSLEGGDISYSIGILSDKTSWLNDYISEFQRDLLDKGHRVLWVHNKNKLLSGDFCFYLSCGQIVPQNILEQFRNNLVVHESDLPSGKGWSPLTWQILEGKHRIPVTLFEAAVKVDSGVIYDQEWIELDGHELIGELREKQAKASMDLCKRFLEGYPEILGNARVQKGIESYYPRRSKSDSMIDPAQSIEAQFDLLRVVDNQKYPAFFQYRNHRYLLKIEKEL